MPTHNLKFKLSERPVLDDHPQLATMDAFALHGEGENDRYLRFSVFYADRGSAYRDLPLDDKKRACMDEAGIADDDPRRASILAWADPAVFEMVRQIIRLQGSIKYALWAHGTEAAWQTIEKLSVNIEDEAPPIQHHFYDDADDDPEETDKLDDSTKYLAKKIGYYGRATVRAIAKKKAIGDNMDEAKVQTAYKTRRDNLDNMFAQVPKLEALGDELFMNDETLKGVAQQQLLLNTPTAERHAEGRTFVKSK